MQLEILDHRVIIDYLSSHPYLDEYPQLEPLSMEDTHYSYWVCWISEHTVL